MAAIKGRNTKPELLVRKALFAQGFRYRLHTKHLPGKPDIVLPRFRAAIFVNGCFWHRHDCHLFTLPQNRREFWRGKLDRNAERDAQAKAELVAGGWRVATVWECALKGKTRLEFPEAMHRLAEWIRSGKAEFEIRGV